MKTSSALQLLVASAVLSGIVASSASSGLAIASDIPKTEDAPKIETWSELSARVNAASTLIQGSINRMSEEALEKPSALDLLLKPVRAAEKEKVYWKNIPGL